MPFKSPILSLSLSLGTCDFEIATRFLVREGNRGKDRSKRVDFLLPKRMKEKEREGMCIWVNWECSSRLR